jgi:PAS domain S-box-containing protein
MASERITIERPDDLESIGRFSAALGIGLILLDREYRISWANEPFRDRTTACPEGQQHTCSSTLWGRTGRCADCLPGLAFATGEMQIGLREKSWAGSELESFRICAVPVFDETGELKWVAESFVNISQLGPCAIDLLGTHRRGSGDSAPPVDASFAVDRQDRIILWSPEARSVFGWESEEILGGSLDLLIPSRLQSEKQLLLDRAIQDEGSSPFETVRLAKDGREIPVKLTVAAIRDTSGATIARSTMVEDLSELRHFRQRYGALERILAHLMRRNTDVVAELSLDGIITSWMPSTGRAFGYAPDDIVGLPLERVVGSKAAQSLLEEVRAEHGTFGRRLELRDPEGRAASVDVTAMLLEDAKGAPFGIVLAVRDADAKLLVERQMLRSEKLAAVGSLAAGLAHEIGTPLNVISATAEYLLLGEGDGSSSREELETIIGETERISKQVRELLAFARESSESIQAVEIGEVIDRVQRLLRVSLERKEVEVEVEIAEGTPTIEARPDAILQLLLNLVLNAVAAVEKGGRVCIHARPARQDGGRPKTALSVEVHDDGPGVPPDLRERIFDPFYTRREDGTGLGLTVCSGIIARHGGDIRVVEGPLGGACFVVQLPAQLSPDARCES